MPCQEKKSQNIDLIINKFKSLTKTKTKREISDVLGVSPQAYSNREKRDAILPLFIEWAVKEGVSVDWLISDKLLSSSAAPAPSVHVENHSPVTGIQNNGYAGKISLSDSGRDSYAVSDSADLFRLVLSVLDSGDQKLIEIMTRQLQTLAEMAGK